MTDVSLNGRTVLAVEDDPFFANVLRRLLERAGASPTVVGSAGDGVAFVESREAPPDVVLTDLELPDMSGVELILRLRAQYPGLPAAVMSGNSVGSDALAPVVREQLPYLRKPFDLAQLTALLTSLLAKPV